MMLAAACAEDGVDKGGGTVDEPPLVTLRIGVPASGEVEYTRATQDETETRINSLTVYDFLVKEKAGGDAGTDTLAAGVQYLIKKEGAGTPEAGHFVSSAGGATATLSMPAQIGTKHVFVCVANEGRTRFDSIMQPGITPIDSLRLTPATRRMKNGESAGKLTEAGAVMTGKTGVVTITENPAYSMQLYRIMARLDVRNNVAAANNLRLVSVSADNCATTGFLFGQGSDKTMTALKQNYEKLVSLKQNAATDNDLKALATGETCRKVLYMYEHLADSCGKETPTPTLLVSYTLNGSPHTMKVPMKTSGGARFDIKRNRLYTLVVGDVTTAAATRIVATIREEGKEE